MNFIIEDRKAEDRHTENLEDLCKHKGACANAKAQRKVRTSFSHSRCMSGGY